MHRFFLTEPLAQFMTITGKDAHHLKNVLRKQVGQEIQIVSSDRVAALMRIKTLEEDKIHVELVTRLMQIHEPSVHIILAQGLPKGDKMDFIVQKAVEMGVATICPISMKNCVVKLDENKKQKKTVRWQKIAEEAAKQSKRDIIPTVEATSTLAEVIARHQTAAAKVVAYEAETTRSLRSFLQAQESWDSLLLVIGPEGGITPEEYAFLQEAGLASVSLGPRILRTETAGLAAVAAILYETGNLGG